MPSSGQFQFGARCKFYFGGGKHKVLWEQRGGASNLRAEGMRPELVKEQ